MRSLQFPCHVLIATAVVSGSGVTQAAETNTLTTPVITAIKHIENGQVAQIDFVPDDERPNIRPEAPPPTPQPPPEVVPELPPAEELLRPPPDSGVPLPEPELLGDRICVTGFEVMGSTVYDPAELAEVAAATIPPETEDCPLPEASDAAPVDATEVDAIETISGKRLAFAQIQQAVDAITQRYVDDNYVTSGAYLPPQRLDTGLVTIEVIEGTVEDIEVNGLERLNPAYVRDRISRSAQRPLNTETLLEGLQLLQIDPLIETLETELTAGTHPGTNRLIVTVSEADPYILALVVDNTRTPLVGSWQRRAQAGHRNLLGQGDRVLVDYSNTDGSNSVNFSYTFPINAANGTLNLSHGRTSSWVIEEPFDFLDIQSRSQYTEFTYRQPLYQTPTQEFAVGVTGSWEASQSRFNPGGFGDLPFPVRGADEEGRTRITVVRLSQEWVRRDSRQVLALRSQFNLGLDAFGATDNPTPPDGSFFSWRGQGQWVWLLAPDTLLQLRGDLQLADRPLLPLEQIGIGGFSTVRGYRQDAFLTDNGFTASAEVRIPIARVPEIDGLLQVIPFLDFGVGWNTDSPNPEQNTLLSTGVGLNWQMYNQVNVRIDYGFPLIDVASSGNTLQEEGLSFFFQYNPLDRP